MVIINIIHLIIFQLIIFLNLIINFQQDYYFYFIQY